VRTPRYVQCIINDFVYTVDASATIWSVILGTVCIIVYRLDVHDYYSSNSLIVQHFTPKRRLTHTITFDMGTHKVGVMVSSLLIAVGLAAALTSATSYDHLRQSCINHVCTAKRITISNSPVNLFDANLIPEFHSFLKSLHNQTSTKVVVLSSDNPDFFADHLDLNLLNTDPPAGVNAADISALYFDSLSLITSIPVVFIAEINGRAFGAGDEVALRTDLRFAGPKAVFGAPEAAGGLLHVGGLQQLVRLIGPSLTMEYLLSSAEVPAREAERVGWVNKSFGSADVLRRHVDRLASRIATSHVEVIRAHKEAVAASAPSRQALQEDMQRFRDLASQSYFPENLKKILTASANQSRLFELNVNDNIVKLLGR
jgi:enoyl-CoA hydratase/carnithine racemase